VLARQVLYCLSHASSPDKHAHHAQLLVKMEFYKPLGLEFRSRLVAGITEVSQLCSALNFGTVAEIFFFLKN
jgi:hypothetical protein